MTRHLSSVPDFTIFVFCCLWRLIQTPDVAITACVAQLIFRGTRSLRISRVAKRHTTLAKLTASLQTANSNMSQLVSSRQRRRCRSTLLWLPPYIRAQGACSASLAGIVTYRPANLAKGLMASRCVAQAQSLATIVHKSGLELLVMRSRTEHADFDAAFHSFRARKEVQPLGLLSCVDELVTVRYEAI